ncbi:MAG: uroporphyrinogen decarboxylase family protein [Planctomycetota bacterium]
MELERVIDRELELLTPDLERLRRGRARQEAVWKGTEADSLPLLLGNVAVDEREEFPTFNKKEQFYDKKKMLSDKLWRLIAVARGGSDAQLSMPADLGAGFVPSVLGLRQRVFEDKDPWLKECLPKDRIAAIEPDEIGDVTELGLMPRAVEYSRYFRQKLGSRAQVCLCGDMFWGPFSLAHLIRRDDLFTDLVDDPPFVHHLMELATTLYVRTVTTVKEAAGEPRATGYRNELYLGDGGVMVNEDTMILVSAAHAEEFAYPYLRRALGAFEGGLVHFCGDGRHLLDSLVRIPELRGVNFGDPRHYDYDAVIRQLVAAGKFYYGGWPRGEGDTAEHHFRRLLAPLEGAKRGLIAAYHVDRKTERPGEVLEQWRSVQEE